MSLVSFTDLSAMWGGGGGFGQGTGRNQGYFLAGAELKVRPLNKEVKANPTVKDTVEISLIFYRDCEVNAGQAYTYPRPQDTMVGLIWSVSKCEYMKFACSFRLDLSDAYATPMCPYNRPTTDDPWCNITNNKNICTKCENTLSSRTGYRTEVYTDTIELPHSTDDWLIGMMYSKSADANLMNFYTTKYGGTTARRCPTFTHPQPPAGLGIPTGVAPPATPYGVRINAINTLPINNNNYTESYFYIEAKYSNNINCGRYSDGSLRTCANTTPHSAGTPFIFICEGRQRIFDVGYFDEEEHTMSFSKSTPMKLGCFGDPACTPGDKWGRSIDYIQYTGIYSKDNPLGSASTYDLNTQTGVLDITMNPPGAAGTGVGKYKAALQIDESDNAGNFVGTVYRDFTITVIQDQECEINNSIGETSYFIDGAVNLVNCATVPGQPKVLEACAGTTMKFGVRAFSTTDLPGASLMIEGEMHARMIADSAKIVRTYLASNLFPTFDSTTSTFEWNIHPNTPAGTYPIIFQIRDCVNGYLLSRSVVYRVRVNKKNKINWSYLNFTPKSSSSVFNLNSKSGRAYHCNSPIPLSLLVDNLEKNAVCNWRMYKGKSCTTNASPEDSYSPDDFWSPTPPNPQDTYCIEMVSNQYCNNRDTLHLLPKPEIRPYYSLVLKDSCFGTKGNIAIMGAPNSSNFGYSIMDRLPDTTFTVDYIGNGYGAIAAISGSKGFFRYTPFTGSANPDTVKQVVKQYINSNLVSIDTIKYIIDPKGLNYGSNYFDWQNLNSVYDGTPSYLSNLASIKLEKKNNTYICYVISADTCIYPVTIDVEMKGLKPRGLFLTDKQYVCPGDTINVSKAILTTSVCSPYVEFSKEKPGSNILFSYPGKESNTNPTPKIFTAGANIDRGKTAILYKGSELCEKGMKPGIVKDLAFFVEGINDPKIYNNIQIWMRCTERFDLQNGQLEDTLEMRKIFEASSRTLSGNAWNTFDITDFVWDGKSNLYFEFWTSCNKPCDGAIANAPAYTDNVTNYVSIVGYYGNSASALNSATPITSNLRPNLRFNYAELLESIDLTWNQNPSTLISRTGGPGNKSEEPRIVSKVPLTYTVVMKNGECKDTTTVFALIDTNYKIRISPDSAGKCPGDTIQLTTKRDTIVPIPMVLKCGPIYTGANCSSEGNLTINKIADSCRLRDSIFNPIIGNPTSLAGTVLQSVYGGGNTNAGNAITDKRIQMLFPFTELDTNRNMRSGYIREIGFEIIAPTWINTNKLLNFTIRMKCVPAEMNALVGPNFESLATFEEVYAVPELATTFGWNHYKLTKPFAWDGKSGIMIDICFDNYSGYTYSSERVRASSFATARCRYQTANSIGAANHFGCTFIQGTVDVIRPNVAFQMCKPTRTPPPIPRDIYWAPAEFISNTRIFDPVIYNEFSTKYYAILDYVDINNKVVCRVRDTMTSIVGRPLIVFEPARAVACQGGSVTVSAGVAGMNQNLFTYEWDTTQYGKEKAYYQSPVQVITPPNPGYHYVTVRSINNPNCYSRDSIWVDIQNLKTMPDLGAAALLCPGDSVTLSIPNDVGYKNPKWRFNGKIIDTGYSIKVANPGAYSMVVDSGACTNTSLDKIITMRQKGSVGVVNKEITICEGDSALVLYNQADNVANPVWNTGSTQPYIKTNQAGIYYLVNPRDQYGCLMNMRDSAVVKVIPNPEFKLIDDTICMSSNQMITLQPIPYDPKATYTWYPDGRKLTSLNVYTSGLYRVVRDLNGCKKEATAFVQPDSSGRINLGKNQAVCCDEVITLDANPEGKKYKGYLWSSGEKSQVIYTKPNVSGLYVVEAIKHNGCKDTGSIFIDSKCAQVKAKPANEVVHIGQENPIIGEKLGISATSITYKWIPSSDTINKMRYPTKDSLNPIAIARDTGDIEYILVMTVVDTNYMPPKEPCVENEVVRFKTLKNQMDTVNIFTPDGDGINDYFYPRVKGVVEFKEFKIYNRYGQLLHDDPKKPWDGKFNGEYQPVGVYVAFISYDLYEARKDMQTKYDKIVVTLVR